MVVNYPSWLPPKFVEYLASWRESRKLILFIVFVALFLDNMLLTTVVPIIPNFLFKLEHPDEYDGMNPTPGAPPSTTPSLADARGRAANCRLLPAYVPPRRQGFGRDLATVAAASYAGGRRRYVCFNTTSEERIQQLLKHHGFVTEDEDDEMYYDDGDYVDEEGAAEESDRLLATSPGTSPGASGRNRNMSKADRHRDIVNENIAVGLMFASKATLQLITNPFVGPITNRIGYSIPMFTGFVIMFISTIVFALGENYTVLFIARALQGIGSACSSVSGMGMLADRYTDDKERGNAMGIALGGLALGVLESRSDPAAIDARPNVKHLRAKYKHDRALIIIVRNGTVECVSNEPAVTLV